MKKVSRFLCCLLLCVCFVCANAAAEIQNPGFEELDKSGFPASWLAAMWEKTEGYSYVEVSTDAYSGTYCALVENAEHNDARFEQVIKVTGGQLYRITCMAKAEGVDISRKGANISVPNVFETSNEVFDTNGEWQTLTLYARAGKKQKEATIMLRLGGYGSENIGKAWFDDVQIEEVDAAPEGVVVANMDVAPPEANANDGDATKNSNDHTVARTLLIAVLFALLCIAGNRAIKPMKESGNYTYGVLFGLAALLFLRVALAWMSPGHEVDINCFISWSGHLADVGPMNFYANVNFCDYPPGYLWVLYPVGKLISALSLEGTQASIVLIMLFPMLCDLAAAFLIYRIARTRLTENMAMILALVYAALPAVIINSSSWGQIDGVLALALLLCIDQMLKKRYRFALPIYIIAVLIKPQALMLGPIGLFIMIYDVIKNKEKGALLKDIAIGLGLGIIAFCAVVIPFTGDQPLTWIVEKYSGTMSSYPYAVLNSYNFFALIGANWKPSGDMLGFFSYDQWGGIFIFLIVAYGAFLTFRSKKRENIYLICTFVVAAIFVFGVRVHERYLFPALLLGIMAYIYTQDVRLKTVLLIFASTLFINEALTLPYVHLRNSEWVLTMAMSILNIAATAYLAVICWGVCIVGQSVVSRIKTPAIESEETSKIPVEIIPTPKSLLKKHDSSMHIRRIDILLMAVLTLAYSLIAFPNLGSRSAPQTYWQSSQKNEVLIIDLGDVQPVERLYYYGGICKGRFGVQFSEDGVTYQTMGVAEYPTNTMFRWHVFHPLAGKGPSPDSGDVQDSQQALLAFNEMCLFAPNPDGTWGDESELLPQTQQEKTANARYIRITALTPGLRLHEIAFAPQEGAPYEIASMQSVGGREGRIEDPELLIDEQDTVPEIPSYYNGTYFDEIYHARTGYEYLHGMKPYETTHPPLGKSLISLGISLFGMTPFGWRFMGTLVGVIMVPLMYLLAMQLFKRTKIATLTTVLLALDFMHFTQTRIATIDSYGVLFTMAMYLFMFRYVQMNFHRDKFIKTLIPLALSGICMGFGIASKWICIYGGIGLAVIFFVSLYQRYDEYLRSKSTKLPEEQKEEAAVVQGLFPKRLIQTLCACLIFFVLVPGVIYVASYAQHLAPSGGVTVSKVIEEQKNMFSYHSGLGGDEHDFRSAWYEWPLMLRPMWYFSGDGLPQGQISSISAMGNPVVWWGGFVMLIWAIYQMIFRGKAKKMRYWLIIGGMMAQYLPWVLVPRSTFIYHYFASVPFLILCFGLFMEEFEKKRKHAWRWAIGGCILAAALFVMFYPLISGMPVSQEYAGMLNWLPRWYLFSGAWDYNIWKQLGWL